MQQRRSSRWPRATRSALGSLAGIRLPSRPKRASAGESAICRDLRPGHYVLQNAASIWRARKKPSGRWLPTILATKNPSRGDASGQRHRQPEKTLLRRRNQKFLPHGVAGSPQQPRSPKDGGKISSGMALCAIAAHRPFRCKTEPQPNLPFFGEPSMESDPLLEFLNRKAMARCDVVRAAMIARGWPVASARVVSPYTLRPKAAEPVRL